MAQRRGHHARHARHRLQEHDPQQPLAWARNSHHVLYLLMVSVACLPARPATICSGTQYMNIHMQCLGQCKLQLAS